MKRFLKLGLVVALVALVALSAAPALPVARAIQQPENDDAFDTAGYNGAPEDTLVTLPIDDFFPPITWTMDFAVDFDFDDGGPFGGGSSSVDSALSSVFEPQYTEEEQFQKQSERNPVPRANIKSSTTIVQPGAEVSAVGQAEGFKTSDGRDLFYAWAINNVSANGTAAGADPQDPPEASAPNGQHSRPTETDGDGDGMDDAWEERYGLNPGNAGDAGEDIDGDAYVNDVYTNELGEILTVTPPSSCGPEFNGSNLCEYIFGTDPNVADTDGDGFLDGMDVAGLGQIELTFQVPFDAQVGETIELRLTTLGDSFQQFDRENNLVKVDSQVVVLTVGDAEQVEASLTASNATPIPGELITLTTTLGQTEYHPGLLTYSWFVNGTFQADASGESRSTFDYDVPQDAVPGDTITVGVRALNFTTGQESSATLELRVSEVVQLEYDTTQIVPGQPYTVTATLLTGVVDPADLVFHWTKDGAPVTDQSGPGKTTYTEVTEGNPGDEFELGLRVTTPGDSETFGDVSAVVGVKQPEVDIITTDSFIEPGQTAELTAVPAHFKSPDLEFRWTVDGRTVEVPLDTRTIEVEGTTVNAVITIEVEVRTAGANPDSARATEFETVVEAGGIALQTDGRPDPATALGAVAAVVQSNPTIAVLGIVVATAAALLAIVAARKRRS